MKRGDQILYMPSHAKDENDPVCERGFVTSVRGDIVFCRYWVQGSLDVLRTKANSEGTNVRDIVLRNSVPQSEVAAMLRAYC